MLNVLFREDIEDVDDVVGVEETPERLPISKIGKSKSEEVDMPGDRSSTGPTGERPKLDILHSVDRLSGIDYLRQLFTS